MPFGITISDGEGKLRGVLWQVDENSEPTVAALDVRDEMLFEGQVERARQQRDSGMLAPVQNHDDAVPRPADWLDFLVWKARPSISVQAKIVSGPYRTDAKSAAAYLEGVIAGKVGIVVGDRQYVV